MSERSEKVIFLTSERTQNILYPVIYFKVDDINRKEFVSRESKLFHYNNGKKKITMSYWEVPEKILESIELLNKWMETSAEISRKGKNKTHKGSPFFEI